MAARSTKFHIDIDDLIREVHYRPGLWNKSCIGYADRRLRARAWDEVCENIFENWKNWSPSHQSTISIEVQKKWRNVKDAFNKEMKRLSGSREKKKRQYIHFKALQFLRNSEAYTSQQAVSIDGSDDESDNTSEEEENTRASSSRKRTRKRNKDEEDNMPMVKREKFQPDEETGNGEHNLRTTSNGEDNLLEIALDNVDYENADNFDKSSHNDEDNRHFVEINCDDWDKITDNRMLSKKDMDKARGVTCVYDEDISFTEMMVPMMRRLNDDQKHFAKIGILNILHKATRYKPTSSGETQTEDDKILPQQDEC